MNTPVKVGRGSPSIRDATGKPERRGGSRGNIHRGCNRNRATAIPSGKERNRDQRRLRQPPTRHRLPSHPIADRNSK